MNWIERLLVMQWLKGEVREMYKYKTVTKVVTAVVIAVGGFFYTPAGQALVHQYPRLSAVVWIVGMLAALLHVPLRKVTA